MSNPRRNRTRRPARRRPFRDPKPVILVVCEGEVTEPEYLRGLKNVCRNPRVNIKIVSDRGDPKILVETAQREMEEARRSAKREGDENLAYDSVWCVFDIDDHHRVVEAVRLARANGIDLAVSNPCFELWLLLHFRDNPGQQHGAKIQQMLAACISDYDKHIDFGSFSGGYMGAVRRAERMERAAEEAGEPGRNPTTGVYRLTESIRGDDNRIT